MMINRLIADYRQRIADYETLRDAEQEALRVARKLGDPEHERAARCADIRCCNVLIQLCTKIIKDLEDLRHIPEGFALVPIEPTTKMREAWRSNKDEPLISAPDRQWKAMIAAAGK